MRKFLEKHWRSAAGVLIVFAAGGFNALGYPAVEHFLLYAGTLIGVGYMPKGTQAK
jgi:hypothetical protein